MERERYVKAAVTKRWQLSFKRPTSLASDRNVCSVVVSSCLEHLSRGALEEYLRESRPD